MKIVLQYEMFLNFVFRIKNITLQLYMISTIFKESKKYNIEYIINSFIRNEENSSKFIFIHVYVSIIL